MQVSLVHEDPEIVSHWCSLVGGSVPTRGRPRRLLVFINPHGGRGQAPALFYNTILPLFSLAGIETKVGGLLSQKKSPSYIFNPPRPSVPRRQKVASISVKFSLFQFFLVF